MSPFLFLFSILASTTFGVVIGGIYVLFRNEDILNLYFEKVHQVEDLRFFETTFKNSNIGMAIVDTDGRWKRVNSRFQEMVGYSERELQEKTFMDITHPDDVELDLNYVRRMLGGDIKTYFMKKRYIHKDGSIVPAGLRVSAVYDDGMALEVFVSQIQEESS